MNIEQELEAMTLEEVFDFTVRMHAMAKEKIAAGEASQELIRACNDARASIERAKTHIAKEIH